MLDDNVRLLLLLVILQLTNHIMAAIYRSCRNPFEPKERMVKRLIGIDGDWVRPMGNKHEVLRVPQGHCWVEGDRTGISGDSNQFGPVSRFWFCFIPQTARVRPVCIERLLREAARRPPVLIVQLRLYTHLKLMARMSLLVRA